MRGRQLTNPAVAPTTNGVQVGTLVMDQDPSLSPGTASVKANKTVKLADRVLLTLRGRSVAVMSQGEAKTEKDAAEGDGVAGWVVTPVLVTLSLHGLPEPLWRTFID